MSALIGYSAGAVATKRKRAEPAPLPRVLQALCAVVALAPLVFLPSLYDPANLPQSAFIQVSALLLLALHLSRRPASLPRPPLVWPLGAFLAWSALSLLWAGNRYEGTLVWMHWAACALIGLVAIDVVCGPREARAVFLSLFAGGVTVALLGALQHLVHFDLLPQAFPPAATFVNKNMAAGFVVMVIPIGAALLLETRTRAPAAGLLAGTGLMALFLVFTQSRSAWLALLAQGMLAAAVWLAGRGWSAWVRWAVPAAGLALALVLAMPRLEGWRDALPTPDAAAREQVFRMDVKVASVRTRLAIWRNTLEMVADHPLGGVGLGNQPLAYPAYARRAVVDPSAAAGLQLDYAHNDYLQLLAELGVVGLGLLAWLGVTLAKTAVAAVRGAGVPALAAVAGLLGVLADATFSFPCYRAVPPLVAAVLLGMLCRWAGEPRHLEAPPWLGRLAFVVAVALAILQYRWIDSDRHCRRMLQAQSRQQWGAVADEAELAHAGNPYRKEPLFQLAGAYLAVGMPERAVAPLRELLAGYPNDANAIANLGIAYALQKDSVSAADCFRRALALRPEEAPLHYRLATALEAQGDAAGALGAYRLASRYGPRNAQYALKWGLAAARQGGLAEAEQALTLAIALDPRSALAEKALGVLLVEALGRPQDGVPHLKRALDLDPNLPDAARMRELVARHAR